MLCTGNICRSPIAEALLAGRLADLGADARVSSAGLLTPGLEAARHGIDVVATRGLDLSGHRSRTLTAEMVGQADLVLGMARAHVREAVLAVPAAWSRTFTLKELVRRGEAGGRRRPDEELEDWLARVADRRSLAGMLGSSPDDDVADPIGHPRAVYERLTDELDDLTGRLVALVWGGHRR